MDEARVLAVEDRYQVNGNGNGHHPQQSPFGGARVVTECIPIVTAEAPDFVDLTAEIEEIVNRTGVLHGFVTVFSKHTTAAVRINENETCLKRDMAKVLERIAPCGTYYEHNDLEIRTENLTEDEDMNGHSHCLQMLMGTSESIPVIGGKLGLGRWQRVFLIELDKPRNREVVVQVLGI